MFDFLKELVGTQDGKILFILALIAGAMIIDFLTGTVAAKINDKIKFVSQKGIDGILRKIVSMIVMVFFIPISILLPNDTGVAMLYTLYLGYLMFELVSILENLKKMGVKVDLFKNFLDGFKTTSK